MKFPTIKKAFFTGIALLIPFLMSAQCAMCRAALQTGDKEGTAEGINHGITYLMMFPYIISGIIGYAIYRIYKKESNPS